MSLAIDTLKVESELVIDGLAGVLKATGGSVSVASNTDIPIMTATQSGAVPTPPNDAAKYLNGQGAWVVPTGGSGDLLSTNNLSDVASAATSRVNLGLDTTANQTDSLDKRFMSDAQGVKVDFISVTQSVDLDTIESDTVANNAKVTNATHTGEVTGSTTLTLDKSAISNRTTVTAVGADYVLISDTSDGGLLKKALASDLSGGGGLAQYQVRRILRR